MANLMRYETAEFLRAATAEEIEESISAARIDGGVGAITVDLDGEDDVTCYVEGIEDEEDAD